MDMTGDDFLHSSDWDLLNLFLPRNRFEREVTWLIGHFIYWVWFERKVRARSVLKLEHLFGFLRFKYKTLQFDTNLGMGIIPGL